MHRQVEPVPAGFHAVTPFLNIRGAEETLAFIRNAFGGQEKARLVGVDGSILHAEIQIGDSIVMVSEAAHLPAMPGNIHLYVNDPDAVFQRAIDAGATIVAPLRDMFWGDRHGRLVDPCGNQWSIAARIEEVSPEEMKERIRKAASG